MIQKKQEEEDARAKLAHKTETRDKKKSVGKIVKLGEGKRRIIRARAIEKKVEVMERERKRWRSKH